MINFKDFEDLAKVQEDYDKFVDEMSPDELIKFGDNLTRIGYCMRGEAKIKEYEELDFEGKFLRLWGPFGDCKHYMYCISNAIRCDKSVEDANLTLWGMDFSWSDSRYTDEAYGNFDAYTTYEERAKWVKEGLEKHAAGDKSNNHYIEVITEEEFIAAYKEFQKFINKDIEGWIECMRVKEVEERRKPLASED